MNLQEIFGNLNFPAFAGLGHMFIRLSYDPQITQPFKIIYDRPTKSIKIGGNIQVTENILQIHRWGYFKSSLSMNENSLCYEKKIENPPPLKKVAIFGVFKKIVSNKKKFEKKIGPNFFRLGLVFISS